MAHKSYLLILLLVITYHLTLTSLRFRGSKLNNATNDEAEVSIGGNIAQKRNLRMKTSNRYKLFQKKVISNGKPLYNVFTKLIIVILHLFFRHHVAQCKSQYAP